MEERQQRWFRGRIVRCGRSRIPETTPERIASTAMRSVPSLKRRGVLQNLASIMATMGILQRIVFQPAFLSKPNLVVENCGYKHAATLQLQTARSDIDQNHTRCFWISRFAFQATQGIASLSAIYFMAPPCVALGAKHGARSGTCSERSDKTGSRAYGKPDHPRAGSRPAEETECPERDLNPHGLAAKGF